MAYHAQPDAESEIDMDKFEKGDNCQILYGGYWYDAKTIKVSLFILSDSCILSSIFSDRIISKWKLLELSSNNFVT